MMDIDSCLQCLFLCCRISLGKTAFIGSDRKMIAKATEVLEQLGLIKTHRMPRYKDSNDNWHTDDIIYICPYRYIWRNNQIIQCTKEEYCLDIS